MAAFTELALYADSAHNSGRLRSAAEQLGLRLLLLPTDPGAACPQPRPDLAWRAPLGMVASLAVRGVGVRLASAGPEWFAALPSEVLGRRVAVVDAGSLAGLAFPARLVKLADAKLGSFDARRTRDTAHAADLARAARLPDTTRLLVADAWLECHSEYRVYCVERQPVAWSPYLVEGEAWGPLLHRHRASFHDEAASFVGDVLAGLPDGDVPPACVLDVARLEDGRLVVLEVNTTWGAGLYGCEPAGVLQAVLAAQAPRDERWLWRPDAVLVERAGGYRTTV